MVTVISEGSTDVSDIAAILVGYFDCDKHLQSADDFYMLVVSIREWLISDTHLDDLVKTLFSISKAVNAMVNSPALGTNGFRDVMYPPLPPKKYFYVADISPHDMRHPFYGYGDNIWHKLLRWEVPLSGLEWATSHLLAFGPLLHAIADGFVKQVYFVAKEWPEYLHSALRYVYIGGGCSDENCRWASHDFDGHNHTKCPLLVKNPVEVEANLSITNHSGRPQPFARTDAALETLYSPPTHISHPPTLPLLSLGGSSDSPLFLGDNPRPPADVPSTNAPHDVYERHEERGSSSEDREPHDSAASTDIARDDPTNTAPVDSNNASVEDLV